MRIYVEPDNRQWKYLSSRVTKDESMLDWRVSTILERIKEGGDTALKEVVEEIE